MALLFDSFLLLVICHLTTSYFAVGDTFGISSMEEPSWSSSTEYEDDLAYEYVFGGRSDDDQSTTSPPVSTTSVPPTTTPVATTTVATTTTTTPPPRPRVRPNKPRKPRIRPGNDHERGTPDSDRRDDTTLGEEDRTQIVNTVSVFKNIVRSIQSEMGEVRQTCDLCASSVNDHSSSTAGQSAGATCEDSRAADAKIKQQLRDMKASIKDIGTKLTQMTQTVNTIGVQMTGVQPRDCMDLFTRGQSLDGVFYLQPTGVDRPFLAACDMHDGGGWTIIQRRDEGHDTDFDLGLGSYRRGFGDPNYSHWLGLDKLHSLVRQDEYELRIELETYQGRRAHAYYSYFKIGDYDSNYVLSVGNYNGSAGDALAFHNGLQFSTKDRDNDLSPVNNCASVYKGGWWYGNCLYANLNGVHIGQEEAENSAIGIIWYDITGYHSSLRHASMAIRPTV